MLKGYVDKYGEENGKYLMETEQEWLARYSNAAYVDSGFGDFEHLKKRTKESAEFMKWNYDELRGDDGLINDFLNGNCDLENFLVVEPGQQIEASNDEQVLKIR